MELFYKGKRVSKKKLGQYPFKDLLEMQNALNRTIINRGKNPLNATYDMSYIKFYQKLVNLELVRRNEIRKTNNLARKRGKVAYEQLQEELYKRSKN